ncbi:MAG: hypothetical protein Q8M15_10840 [Bacteroidota bacterium]|nr:hypothetical protein [Bacteroidota bacterium]
MQKQYFIALVLSILTMHLSAQESLNYKSKLQTNPSVGINIPITKLLNGKLTDYLIEYDDQSYYWQIISGTFFFHKYWGIEFNFQANSSNSISKRADNFLQSMQSEYGNEYFVTPSTGAGDEKVSIISGNFERGYLGLIYRIESEKYFIYPKIAIGVTSFYTDWGKAYLKKKNFNDIIEISYSSGKAPNDFFIIATSATFGYKLTKRIFFNFDIGVSHYKTDLTFIKTMTDINSGQSTKEDFAYKKNVFNLSLGTGIIIVIK